MWEYKQNVFSHFASYPGDFLKQKYIDTVVALAQKADLFLFDLGYFKIKALAKIAATSAYFVCRLNHQTTLLEAEPTEWPRWSSLVALQRSRALS